MRYVVDPPCVIICLETARGFGRDLLRGIASYAHANGPWNFRVTTGEEGTLLPKDRTWNCAGIVACIPNDGVAEEILTANVPTIGVCLGETNRRLASLLSNHAELNSEAAEVGPIAVSHFLTRDLKNLAFVGNGKHWSTRREQSFCQSVSAEGLTPHVFPLSMATRSRGWEAERLDLVSWIRELPCPVGVLACNDERGQQVLEACRLAGLRVPEDVAVLGVDNDDLFCALANPPLSSIALNTQAAGYRVAELLDAMIHGGTQGSMHVDVAGIHVVPRRSTDPTAVSDENVQAALQFIHNHERLDVTVSDVARVAAVSRRMLERRFRKALGRSVMEEIQTTRMERAKKLLRDTNLPIGRIAQATGFGTTEYFITVFRRLVGRTPRTFRDEVAPSAYVS